MRPGGDPWSQASPSRRFAVLLHRFGWMGDLMAMGEAGAREALRLTLEWRRVFGRWNGFAWSADILERRVLNLACAGRAMAAAASDAEAASLADSLARQARHLLALVGDAGARGRAAGRRGVAGAAWAAPAGERLMRDAAWRGWRPCWSAPSWPTAATPPALPRRGWSCCSTCSPSTTPCCSAAAHRPRACRGRSTG